MATVQIGGAKLAALAVALGMFALAATAVAKCGDAAGDMDAVASTRGDVNSTCDCATAASHGDHVRCARGVIESALMAGTLPPQCASTVLRCARKSTCGRKPGFVPCCRTGRNGATKCSIKSGAAHCHAPPGGSACYSSFATSCCDACNAGGCVQPTPTSTPTPRPTPTPPGFCQTLVGLPALAHVPITLQPGTDDCGGPAFVPGPQPPLTGQVNDGTGTKLADLGLGCLYTGMLPPTKLSSGGTTIVDVVGIGAGTATLGGSDGSGPLDCTKGAGPLKHCANGAAGTDGMGLCDTDGDCNNKLGTCLPDAHCFFGPPVPVPGAFPACAVNALQSDMCGALNLLTFETHLMAVISSRTYLTFNADSPCPLCTGGTCTYGKNAGLPCTPIGSYSTSPDCPPDDGTFLAALQIVIPDLTTGTSTLTADAAGSFCDAQTTPGAFGLPDARQIVQTGVGALAGGTSGITTSVATFCIYPTGNPIIDFSGGFPAAGTLSAKSQIDISQVLLGGLLP